MNWRASFAAMLVLLTGCHWKAEAEDFKKKWIEEIRYHYQTQMIKNAEVEKLNKDIEALKKENQELKDRMGN